MKKNIFLFFLLIMLPLHAQEKKYLVMSSTHFFIYTPMADGSFLRKYYFANYNKMGMNSETFVPSEEEIKQIYKESVLLSSVNTDAPEDFRYLVNKPFTVRNKKSGEVSKFCFYGSGFLKEDYPSFNFSGDVITPSNRITDNDASPYTIFQVDGKTFFIMDGQMHLFQKDKILQNIFPDAEVKFTDKNFASRDCQTLVKIVSTPGDANESFYRYGVTTVNGIEVLPSAYEKIYIATDAILVKNKGLWYFYDFFGNKIMEKGFRKILPLHVMEEMRNLDSGEERKIYKKGVLTYAVLDRNEIKIMDNIYQQAKKSEFVSLWRLFSTCGNIPTRRMSVSSAVRLKGNTFSISRKTDVYGYRYISDGYSEDKVTLNNSQSVDIDEKGYGELSYLNRTDSSFVVTGSVPSSYYFFMKSRKNNRERLKVINSNCLDNQCSAYGWNIDQFPSDGIDLSYDRIEDFKSEIDLLTLGGNYIESFNFRGNPDAAENNNLLQDTYYKLYDKGKVGLFSPRSIRLNNVKVKYKKLEDLKNRFARFEDENGKKGWLSEDSEEFYDL
ncbi:hypothetical protein F3J23_21035 [Chryseobacterium sp. Tr-659]|uniref:hypothetical protein n=1 Tax=Chryseobacterium sp. Tr-659 TaxID=2608340 RepID=UPI00141EEF2F|nr:hypothetical protein [Chryseobacterium sp. Tr-659]NIF07916.1 hypothetical protein [Chryseobacterium sp. Tr-659]